MDNRFAKALKAILDLFEAPFDMRKPENRRQAQYLLYLLQTAGRFDLGFRYRATSLGPYCEDLVCELDQASRWYRIWPEMFGGVRLREDVVQAVERTKPLTLPPPKAHLGRPAWLDVLVVMDYVTRIQGRDVFDAIVKVKSIRPEATSQALQLALDTLRRHHLADAAKDPYARP